MTGLAVTLGGLLVCPAADATLDDHVSAPNSQRFAFGVALAGAFTALAAGILLGVALKPELAGNDLASGPQQLAGRSAQRAALSVEQGAALGAYQGQLPDYVLGADART